MPRGFTALLFDGTLKAILVESQGWEISGRIFYHFPSQEINYFKTPDSCAFFIDVNCFTILPVRVTILKKSSMIFLKNKPGRKEGFFV